MNHKEKVTISLAPDWIEELDRNAGHRHTSRSALIEEALEVWRREQLNRELAAGYRAMADEDRQTAERNLGSGLETFRD
jgi:metal-responsive CopG/Arc/MetJ family transcriptional regulator